MPSTANLPKKSIISVYYQNLRSINNKLSDISSSTSIDEYDVLLFTETWLKPEINNNELKLFNYNIYRCDRSKNTSFNERAGGVMIATKDFPSHELKLIHNNVEQIFVLITIV